MKGKLKLETYELSAEFERIGNEAVREAQEKNRKKGIPNVYCPRKLGKLDVPIPKAGSSGCLTAFQAGI